MDQIQVHLGCIFILALSMIGAGIDLGMRHGRFIRCKMRKFFSQKSEPIKMLIQQMNWKIFHFEGNGGSVSSVVDSVEIDALLDRSKLLWGLAPSEFLWCGDEKNKIEQSLKSQLTKLEQNSAEGGMLVIPHVDGGLIVIVSDEHSKIADGKPADWWSLHY